MVAHAIARCGTADQRQRWLPEVASGRRLAAFCLTEAEAGSDPAGIATSAAQEGADYVLDGEKKWTTGAQTAGLFLVIAKSTGAPVAFLVDAAASGVSVRPTARLLGTRASMLGDVRFDRCAVPAADRIGPPGFGLSHVAATALDMGRYGVAWGCVGLIQACVDASRRHAQERRQFGRPLLEHQLVRRMISDMTTDLRAARLLALHAGQLKDAGDPEAPLETVAAKYFASRAARRAAADTVQIHGAAGCLDASEAARLYRDAKIMEIIEGSNEINQIGIAGWSDADE
jgi:alkylation response protein AidB-like acyl-CoA dehydrogenase